MDIKSPTKDERIALHRRGIKMIMVTMLLGVIAGLLSSPYVLSQPVYGSVMHDGTTDLRDFPTIMLDNAYVLTPNASDPASVAQFAALNDSGLLLSATSAIANTSTLLPNASVLRTNALISTEGASLANNDTSIMMSHASVTLTNLSEVPSDTQVLLTNGIVLLPNPSDTTNATVLLSSQTTRRTNPHAPDHSSFGFLILALLIYVQKFIFPPLGIDSSKFGFKDWFFLSFMTFCFWFITWTVILNGPLLAFGPLV